MTSDTNTLSITSVLLLILGFIDRIPAWVQLIGIIFAILGSIVAIIRFFIDLKNGNFKKEK